MVTRRSPSCGGSTVRTGGGGSCRGIGSIYSLASFNTSSADTSPTTTITQLFGAYPILKCAFRSSIDQLLMSDGQPTTGHPYGCAV